jgi:hypothetical protein
MKTLTREELKKKLEAKYPGMACKMSEGFSSDYKGGIWLSGENGLTNKKGKKLFNYYAEDRKNYELGVLNEIYSFLENRGWYAEWYDAGTIMLWLV